METTNTSTSPDTVVEIPTESSFEKPRAYKNSSSSETKFVEPPKQTRQTYLSCVLL